MSDQPLTEDNISITRTTRRLLGTTVLMVQLPLALHLPWWLTVPGILLVLIRILPTFASRSPMPPLVLVPLAVIAATGIYLYYGHIFGRDPCVAFLFLLTGFKFAESYLSLIHI